MFFSLQKMDSYDFSENKEEGALLNYGAWRKGKVITYIYMTLCCKLSKEI